MQSRMTLRSIIALFIIMEVFVNYSAFASTIHIPADYPTIQQGIDSSSIGDTILVHPGTYIENLNYNGKNITVTSLYILTLDTSYISSTVIDGSGFSLGLYGSCVSFHTGETSQAQLIGFTITNGSGNAWFVSGVPARYGGGVFIQNASPTLHHLRIKHNKGGINGNLILPGAGGGILLDNSSSAVHHIELIDNSACTPDWDAPNAGGALFIANCSNLSIVNVKMFNDTCCSFGGAVSLSNSNVDFINCLIVGNYSHSIGGGIGIATNSTVRLINTTISDNHSDYFAGGGVYSVDNTTLHIVNSILWENTPYEIALDNSFSPTNTFIGYSDVEGGIDSIYQFGSGSFNWLEGNINANPVFTNPSLNDFTLAWNSPCINAGNPDTTSLHLPPYDLKDLNRIVNTIDIGAYENQSTTGLNAHFASPDVFWLAEPYPNPFNPTTTLSFHLPSKSFVSLKVFDILGREVATIVSEELPAGEYSRSWTAVDVASGVYFCRIQAGSFTETKKVMLLR